MLKGSKKTLIRGEQFLFFGRGTERRKIRLGFPFHYETVGL